MRPSGREVAIEVDGPLHFCGRMPSGATALKRRQLRAVALYQDFRKFEKNSKAGAEQEIFSKMASAAKKKSGIPQKIWGSNPGIELGQLTRLITKSPGNQLCTCLFEVGR